MIAVKFTPPKNPKLVQHIDDQIRETCKSFGAVVVDRDPNPGETVVYLSAEGGDDLGVVDLTGDIYLMVGCDDDQRKDDPPPVALSVKIKTPVDYYLWSPVALGILLFSISEVDR